MRNDEFEKSIDQLVKILVEVRKEKGVSHERLSEISGLSRTAISYIESRKSTPSIITCMRLCKALDIKLSELLKKIGS